MKHMNKHWIKAALLAAGVLVGNAAWAQASCSDGGIPFSGGPMAGLCSNGSPPQAGGGGGGGGRSGGYVPPTVIHLPTSYGAVAWDGKTNTYGYSSKQASKQAALADCGTRGCKIINWYSNSCSAAAFGNTNKKGWFTNKSALNPQDAERNALNACYETGMPNCQIVMSECSLAGDINGR